MEQWIKDEIMKGLEKSFNFGFLGEPKNLSATAEAWFEVFENTCKKWTQERDAGRILKAFDAFFMTGKRFPLPVNIIELLPKREPQLALPRPERTDEERMTASKYFALFAFQSSNEDFKKLLGEAMRNDDNNSKFIDIARRVLAENKDLKEQAVAFFKNYKEKTIKEFNDATRDTIRKKTIV